MDAEPKPNSKLERSTQDFLKKKTGTGLFTSKLSYKPNTKVLNTLQAKSNTVAAAKCREDSWYGLNM